MSVFFFFFFFQFPVLSYPQAFPILVHFLPFLTSRQSPYIIIRDGGPQLVQQFGFRVRLENSPLKKESKYSLIVQ